MKAKALTPEQKAAIIKAARFACAQSSADFLNPVERQIFYDRVNADAQHAAAKEFKGRSK